VKSSFSRLRSEKKKDHIKRLLGVYADATFELRNAREQADLCAMGHHGKIADGHRRPCDRCMAYLTRSIESINAVASAILKRIK
jgi:hypothetical protein